MSLFHAFPKIREQKISITINRPVTDSHVPYSILEYVKKERSEELARRKARVPRIVKL